MMHVRFLIGEGDPIDALMSSKRGFITLPTSRWCILSCLFLFACIHTLELAFSAMQTALCWTTGMRSFLQRIVACGAAGTCQRAFPIAL